MTGGVVAVNGPTESMNGALDYDGTFNISGGTIVAVGSAGMAQAATSDSTQNSVLMGVGNQSAGTVVELRNAAGENLLSFTPAKSFAAVFFSSPDLAQGETYTLYLGGSKYGGFTQSAVVTTLGGTGR